MSTLLHPHAQPVQPDHLFQVRRSHLVFGHRARCWSREVGYQRPGGEIGQGLRIGRCHHSPFCLVWPIGPCYDLQCPPVLCAAISKRPGDEYPLARLLSILPTSHLGHFLQRPWGAYPMPPVMRGLEGEHIAQLECSESCSQGAILSVEVISHHCSKRDSLRGRPVDQFQCDLEFCPKSGIVLTF